MNNAKIEKKDFEAYLKEARSWETDKVRQVTHSARLAWRVATAAAVAAVLAIIALVGLTPLKQVVPYVIRVDNSSGRVDIVEALTNGKTNYDEALNRYFAQQYVRVREGYSHELAPEYYYDVGIMSSQHEAKRYFAAFTPQNPNSPLNVYNTQARVRITITSTSFLNDHVASVRYDRAIDKGDEQDVVTHWVATVTFKYVKAPMGEKDRGINPLGFQVQDYRNDPDTSMPDGQSKVPQQPIVMPVTPATSVFPTAPVPAPAPTMTAPALNGQTYSSSPTPLPPPPPVGAPIPAQAPANANYPPVPALSR